MKRIRRFYWNCHVIVRLIALAARAVRTRESRRARTCSDGFTPSLFRTLITPLRISYRGLHCTARPQKDVLVTKKIFFQSVGPRRPAGLVKIRQPVTKAKIKRRLVGLKPKGTNTNALPCPNVKPRLNAKQEGDRKLNQCSVISFPTHTEVPSVGMRERQNPGVRTWWSLPSRKLALSWALRRRGGASPLNGVAHRPPKRYASTQPSFKRVGIRIHQRWSWLLVNRTWATDGRRRRRARQCLARAGQTAAGRMAPAPRNNNSSAKVRVALV